MPKTATNPLDVSPQKRAGLIRRAERRLAEHRDWLRSKGYGDDGVARKLEANIEWLRRNPGASGSAFARCVKAVTAGGSAYGPRAVCASAGRKKYGKKAFQEMALAGKRRAKRGNPAAIWALEQKRGATWERRVVGGDQASMKGTLEWYRTNYPSEKWRIVSLKKRNPAALATEAFEEFHGHAPTETVEVKKQVHFHKHLAGAGKLIALMVKGVDHRTHFIGGFKGALLAFNEQKNQLFVEGGDQGLNLAQFGITEPHELETLGKVLSIDYSTDKSHLGKEGGKAVYAHQFRTTNEDGEHVTVTIARYPDLIYRALDEQLEFSGGSYQIKAEGIDR